MNFRLLGRLVGVMSMAMALYPLHGSYGQGFAPPPPRPTAGNGFLYQPSKGFFWDPSVIYANQQYYMFSMYGGDSVWLADPLMPEACRSVSKPTSHCDGTCQL